MLVTLPRMLVAYASARGADGEALAARAGLHPLPPGNDARVPREKVDALFDLAQEALGDPGLGVHLALAMPAGNTGVLEVVVQSAPDLATALGHVVRYWRLINDGVEASVREVDDHVEISVRTVAPKPLARAWIDLTVVAMGVQGLRSLAVRDPLVFVALPYAADAVGHQIGALLGEGVGSAAIVRFDAPHITLGLRREALAAPLINRNAAIHALATAHAEALLAARSAEDAPVLDRARAAVRARLEAGDASVERVARDLALSPRTLQRTLRAEGTSLRALVDEARTDIAKRELARGDRSITDLAFLLGFSETSAFDRAFRRWTGKTPLAFRGEHAR